MYITVSGTPNGSETLTVNPQLNSIYDLAGNVATTSQINNTIGFELYTLSSFTFRTQTVGADGPSLANVRALYGSDPTLWTNNDDYLSMESNRQGIQIWTVPKTGYYKFDVYGAGGNDPSNNDLGGYISGYSRNLSGYVYLTINEKIHIACGQNGEYIVAGGGMVGGHGGTFVIKEDDTPLIITGGASGALNHYYSGTPQKQTNGMDILASFSNGVAYSRQANLSNYLNNGYGGDINQGDQGAGGGGFYGDGEIEAGWHIYIINAKGWGNGLNGGKSGSSSWVATWGFGGVAEGGFGGGAGTTNNGAVRPGAGGGYSGGRGAWYSNNNPAGAGGSYYNTTLVSGFTFGNQYSGHGKVIVTFESSYIPVNPYPTTEFRYHMWIADNVTGAIKGDKGLVTIQSTYIKAISPLSTIHMTENYPFWSDGSAFPGEYIGYGVYLDHTDNTTPPDEHIFRVEYHSLDTNGIPIFNIWGTNITSVITTERNLLATISSTLSQQQAYITMTAHLQWEIIPHYQPNGSALAKKLVTNPNTTNYYDTCTFVSNPTVPSQYTMEFNFI